MIGEVAERDARRRGQTIGRAAVMIGVITVLARLVGFGRQVVFAHTVGTTCLGTAYTTANMVPNIIYDIVLGGALSSVVVPVLAGPAGESRTGEQARRIASSLLTWTVLLLVPVSAVLALAARPIVSGLLSGASGCPRGEMVGVGARMLIVFAPQVLLYGLAVVLYGILQSHRRFGAPALAPLLSSLVVIGAYAGFGAIGGAYVFGNRLHELPPFAEYLLSVGTTLGVLALVITAIIPARRLHIGMRPTLRFPSGVGSRVRRLALAGVVTLVAQDASAAVVIVLANHYGNNGALVIYGFAWAVFVVPYAVLAVPIATSAFPALSATSAAMPIDAPPAGPAGPAGPDTGAVAAGPGAAHSGSAQAVSAQPDLGGPGPALPGSADLDLGGPGPVLPGSADLDLGGPGPVLRGSAVPGLDGLDVGPGSAVPDLGGPEPVGPGSGGTDPAHPESAGRASSGSAASPDDAAFDWTAAASSRAVVVASWLGTAALIGARAPLARVFESHSTMAASILSLALAAFAPGLVGYGLSANLSRVLYARRRNRAPALAIGGGWLLVIVANLLIVPFVPPDRVVPALGLGTTFGLTVSGVALLILVRRERGSVALHGVSRAFFAGLAGCAAGAVAGSVLASVLPVTGFLLNIGMSVLVTAVITGVFTVVVLRLDGGDLRSALSRLRSRRPAS